MLSLLMADKIKVSEHRVLASMHRVDPEGVLIRTFQLITVARCKYSVPGVLALWHIDGHHKLIRFVPNYCLNYGRISGLCEFS